MRISIGNRGSHSIYNTTPLNVTHVPQKKRRKNKTSIKYKTKTLHKINDAVRCNKNVQKRHNNSVCYYTRKPLSCNKDSVIKYVILWESTINKLEKYQSFLQLSIYYYRYKNVRNLCRPESLCSSATTQFINIIYMHINLYLRSSGRLDLQ